MKGYIIGSLRNEKIPEIGNRLRAIGVEAFDDWHGGGPEADDMWQKYERTRGRSYADALYGEAAANIFQFDKRHLDASDFAVMVAPAGRSGHLELGYMVGQGKPAFVLFDGEPERWDVMYQFCTAVFFTDEELIAAVKELVDGSGGQVHSPNHNPVSFALQQGRRVLGVDVGGRRREGTGVVVRSGGTVRSGLHSVPTGEARTPEGVVRGCRTDNPL